MSQDPCRVLIVDDSLEDRTVVRLLLDDVPGRCWSVIEEEKGGRALERLEIQHVDCILLDYQLPEMDGIRFIKEVNQRFGPLRFPIVMFTGSGQTSVAVEAMKAGAQDYLSKDRLGSDALVYAIDHAMERVGLLRSQEQQQKELEATNARLRLLEAALKATAESVVITDANIDPPGPEIVFVNDAFTNMSGYAAEEVIGRSPTILWGPKTDPDILERLQDDLFNGRQFSGKTIGYRKDGREFIMECDISPIVRNGERPTHYVAVQRDVTERRQAAQKLRESEQRCELALRGADLGLWDYNVSTGQVTYNEGWATMLGYRAEQIEPTFEARASLVHPEDWPATKSALDRHLRGETPVYEAEFRIRTADGKWRWILSRGKVLERSSAGIPLRVAGTHRDITDRRQQEAELRRSNEDLQQFAHTISHDLQEPLRMMASYSQLLARKYGDALDGDSALFLNTIQDGAQRASRLISDLLAYAQADAEQQNLLIEPCSLEEVLKVAVTQCRRQIENSQAVVEHGPLPVVDANRAQLGQLFQNLLSNALKYRSPERPPRIQINAQLESGQWTISVRDNGIGFDPAKAEYIFGVFKRLHEGNQSGTGLGLALCKRIVERFGGSIWAESQPGGGSTFKFKLPASERHSMAHSSSPEADRGPLRNPA